MEVNTLVSLSLSDSFTQSAFGISSGLKWHNIQAHMRNIYLFLPTCSCINQRSSLGNRRLVSLRCGTFNSPILPFSLPPRFLVHSQPHLPLHQHISLCTNANFCRFFSPIATDLDNVPASFLRYRRVYRRKNHPLARRRLLSLNRWHSTLDRAGRLSRLHHSRIVRKGKVLHANSRRNGGIQLPQPGLGQGSLGRHRRQGGRHHHRFRRAELFPAESRCCCQGWKDCAFGVVEWDEITCGSGYWGVCEEEDSVRGEQFEESG